MSHRPIPDPFYTRCNKICTVSRPNRYTHVRLLVTIFQSYVYFSFRRAPKFGRFSSALKLELEVEYDACTRFVQRLPVPSQHEAPVWRAECGGTRPTCRACLYLDPTTKRPRAARNINTASSSHISDKCAFSSHIRTRALISTHC